MLLFFILILISYDSTIQTDIQISPRFMLSYTIMD